MSQISPRLNLPLLAPAQAQKHVTHNEALARLDLLVQLTVQAFDAVTPPAEPAEGEIFALGPAPTGEWSGQAGQLAGFSNGSWVFITPQNGWQATLAATGAARVWRNGVWDVQPFERLGVNANADATNRLAVASDAVLLTHDGAGHQVKVNKATATDTASLLFQTGWSGRAEMGTAGNDGFAIKVSDDGAAWRQALQVDPATGHVGIGPEADTSKALGVAINATAPAICIHNTGGAGGAEFELIDDTSGGHWKFKTVQDGSFKLRDHGNGIDHMFLYATPRRTAFTGGVQPSSYPVASLPDPAAMGAGCLIYVPDESSGAVMAFSDGTNWRRMTDRAVVS